LIQDLKLPGFFIDVLSLMPSDKPQVKLFVAFISLFIMFNYKLHLNQSTHTANQTTTTQSARKAKLVRSQTLKNEYSNNFFNLIKTTPYTEESAIHSY
jgi:hypothetical protein